MDYSSLYASTAVEVGGIQNDFDRIERRSVVVRYVRAQADDAELESAIRGNRGGVERRSRDTRVGIRRAVSGEGSVKSNLSRGDRCAVRLDLET